MDEVTTGTAAELEAIINAMVQPGKGILAAMGNGR
jgi:hypothetical protein